MRFQPFTRQVILTVAIVAGLSVTPALAQNDAAPAEGRVLAHWDFEGETHDAAANTWSVTDKSGPPLLHATADGRRVRIESVAGSNVFKTQPHGGFRISAPELNGDFKRGLVIKARLSLDELVSKKNYLIANKGSAADTTFNLFFRDTQIRFTVGDGADTTSVYSGHIEANTTYDVTARFDPDDGRISLTVVGGGREYTRSESVSHDALHVSDQQVTIAGSWFVGWIDDVRIIVPEGQ